MVFAVAIVFVLSALVPAHAAPGVEAESAGAFAGHLPRMKLLDGHLGIARGDFEECVSSEQVSLGIFLGCLNDNPSLWRVEKQTGRLMIDTFGLAQLLGTMRWVSDPAAVVDIAARYQGRRVDGITDDSDHDAGSEPSVLATYPPYYEDVETGSGNYYDEHDAVVSSWLQGPGTVSASEQVTYSWGFSVSGAEYSKIIAWLGVQVGWGHSTGTSYSFPVEAGQDGRAHKRDKHYHTWVEYNEYYYECPDIPGVYECIYLGFHHDSSEKFYERVYWCEYRPTPIQ